jgi:RWP-RK domain
MLKDLSFELVAPKFGMPFMEAAKQLWISIYSTLQLWCRINGIPQWPYRKIRSMEILLTNVQVTLNYHLNFQFQAYRFFLHYLFVIRFRRHSDKPNAKSIRQDLKEITAF